MLFISSQGQSFLPINLVLFTITVYVSVCDVINASTHAAACTKIRGHTQGLVFSFHHQFQDLM